MTCARLEKLLLQGAKAHGWHNSRWTAARVARLIKRQFHRDYHPEHVRKILQRRLGWTSQKPRRKARERNDKEGARWVGDEFPRIVREAWQRFGLPGLPRRIRLLPDADGTPHLRAAGPDAGPVRLGPTRPLLGPSVASPSAR